MDWIDFVVFCIEHISDGTFFILCSWTIIAKCTDSVGLLPYYFHEGSHKKSLSERSSERLIKGGGGDLLYRNAVPSALQGLTAVFGMGTGGTPVP